MITIQLLITVAFVITTAISAVLAYDLLLKKQGKEPIFTNKEALDISNTIKYLTFAMIVVILFINIRFFEIDKEKEEEIDSTNDQVQILISFITLIASGIGVWLAIKNTKLFNLASIENPEV